MLLDLLPPSVRMAVGEAETTLREQYGTRLKHIVLYGSQIRGTAHDESDIDVLVVLDDPVQQYEEVKRLVDVSMKLFDQFGHWVSFKVMPLSDYEDPTHPLMINVRKEGVAL